MRDCLGYAIGAVLAGVTADALGLSAAMWIVAALTAASGLVVAVRMKETMRTKLDVERSFPSARERVVPGRT